MRAQHFCPPSYPAWADLSPYTRSLVTNAQQSLPDLEAFHRGLLKVPIELRLANPRRAAGASGVLKVLERPMSDAMVAKYGLPSLVTARSDVEENIFKLHFSELARIAEISSKQFIELIELIASSIHAEDMKIRKGVNVITKPDSQGDHWKYLNWRLVKRELFNLHAFIKQNQGIDKTVFQAAVFLGAFNCIHPLRDGNGRTSRILFNGILQSHFQQPVVYVPLKEFMGLSRYGFELSMRESILFGRWSTLLVFCSNTLLIMDAVTQGGTAFDWTAGCGEARPFKAAYR